MVFVECSMAANNSAQLHGDKIDKFYQERVSWTETLKDFRDQQQGTKFPERSTNIARALADFKQLVHH